jgi:large subunit ribosomal protein L5
MSILELYKKEVVKKLQDEFKYENVNEVPRLIKVCINRSLNVSKASNKSLDIMVTELANITGQKPLITKSKKSISNFKLRENVEIGCKVTMRGERMYAFVGKLKNIVLPKIRDFRGISVNSFDGSGNYTLGIKEQTIFPEIDYEKIEGVRGMDITFVTTAKTDAECRALLAHFGFPFRKN